jgi:hypothetical protein
MTLASASYVFDEPYGCMQSFGSISENLAYQYILVYASLC